LSLVILAPGGNWNSDAAGDVVYDLILKLVESPATLT
jgi:hypothetical protein